jgi:3',5'-cyclic AMP phosphodiesterase CpdA
MKHPILLLFAILLSLSVKAQNFKYAFVTDTHVGSSTGEEDLNRTVADLNGLKDIDFVIITGDITEMGTNNELKLAKDILSKLNKLTTLFPATTIPDGLNQVV